ncbi:hypothetical protein OT109_16405 [Phycisphaeraceae bacterium D3-23]
MPDPATEPSRRIPQPALVFFACAAAFVFVMVFAIFGALVPGAQWALGMPLNLVPALGVAGLLWAAAFGLGDPIRRWLLPNPTGCSALAQAALGMAALLLALFVLFWIVGVNHITALLPIALGVGILLWRLYQSRQQLNQLDLAARAWPWTLPTLAPGVALLLVAAACPPGTLWRVEAFAYDVTSYHLQIPKEWIAVGRATPLDHNVYSFLPGLIEHSYTAIGLIFGGGSSAMRDAVYACQVFHASFALLAVWGVVEAARRFGPTPAAVVAGGALLLTPWVVVTGSLAYNEMAALGFSTAALAIALQPGPLGWRRGAALGLLLGAATLCKLPAGPMIALPIAVIALSPDKLTHTKAGAKQTVISHRLQLGAAIAIAGLITLAPYFARNAIATGNPIFPFATTLLGSGHWDNTLSDRWHTAHMLDANHAGTFDALSRQWLRNIGYGALGGTPVPPESNNIARFSSERGLPVLWLAVLTGCALMLGHPRTWRTALVLIAFLLWQLVFWRLTTHLQSRFLIYTLVPGSVMLAIGAGRVREVTQTLRGVLPPIATMLLILTLLTVSLTTLWQQAPELEDDGVTVHRPIWMAIDSLGDPNHPDQLAMPGMHPINLLGPETKTLIVGDNSSLLYIERPIVYGSAFDSNPLAQIARAANGDIAEINAALRAQGITHVWVGWSEVARLAQTYGFDEHLPPDLLLALAESWRPALDPSWPVPLYRLPPAELEAGHAGADFGGAGILPAIAAQR